MTPQVAYAALMQLAEGVIITDADGRITFVNDAAARLHGVSQLDVPPEQYAHAYHLFMMDGAPYPSSELPLARAVRGETVGDARWRIRRHDQSEVVARGSAVPVLDHDGHQVGAVLTLRDDTARDAMMAAERERDELAGQLHQAFEQSPASTVVYDATGRPIAANAAFERLWGASLADVPSDYSVLSDPQLEAAGILPALRRAFGLDATAASAEAGEAVKLPAICYDVATTTGRGRTLWTEASAYPVRDANGAVERVVLSHEDVTARIKTEQALHEALAALESRNEQLQRQAVELEAVNTQLRDSAAELEEQRDELHRASEELATRGWAAEKSERRVRAVLESISDAFYALDREWNFTYVNARASEILGRTSDELLGRSIWVEFAPALGTAFDREYHRAMDTGEVVTFEERYEPLDGWFEIRAYPGPDGLSVYFRDITKRRAADAAKRETEERLRLAVESTGLGTWDFVPANDALHWDVRTKRAFGLSEDTEVPNFAAFTELIHPDDRPRTLALIDAALDPAGSGEFDTMYRVVQQGDGECWVRARGRVLFTGEGDSRHVTRFIGTVLDVTSERNATAERERLVSALEIERTRLSTVFAETPSVLAIVRGPNYVVEMANAAYLALNGNRDVLGKPLLDAVPELRGQGFDKLLDSVMESGEPFMGREIPIWLSTSPELPPEERIFDFVYLPLVEADETGSRTRVGVIAHGNDITDQVRARHEVEAARVEAERQRFEAEAARADAERQRLAAEHANAAKSDFLSTMSHELRTPLNAIAGYTQLLTLGLRGPVNDAQRNDLERIRIASEHLMSLVNDVLNFARVEAGKVEYHLERVDFATVVAELEPLVNPQLAAKGLSFDHDGCAADTTEPHRVLADAEKLRQILLNLLTNAIKFTEAGGRVWLLCETDIAGEVIRIRVSDTGRGIPADEIERIFEPFVQVERHRTEGSQQGVGLGLSISRDLARGMGGDLSAESALGVGSTFTLTLPRAQE